VTLLLIRLAVWGNVAPVTALAIGFVIRTVENRLDHTFRHTPGRRAVADWLQQRANSVAFTISDPDWR